MSNALELCARYREIRAASVALVEPLSAEDCCAQAMADASPAKWHLAHTTWFFETFILERWSQHHKPFHETFRVLFNSYYNAVGDKYPRPQRGLLTRPSLCTVLDYRGYVDSRIAEVLAADGDDGELIGLVTLGLHHEQQHQELILTDIKYLFFCNPLAPAYGASPLASLAASELAWLDCPGGVVEIGHRGSGFCYDNEAPRHRVFLQPYRLASRLISNGEYLAFVEAGGYAEPNLWLAEGWDWRTAHQVRHPLYWKPNSEWRGFTLNGWVTIDLRRPVIHLSYYEADAYARWAEARLPSEAEWEHAASQLATGGYPAAAPEQPPVLAQLLGDAWQWTRSSYAPYPGFRASAGAVGEYNGKFMVNQYVLRGGSCVTPKSDLRATYRNFFPASARWQFSGIRLARDL